MRRVHGLSVAFIAMDTCGGMSSIISLALSRGPFEVLTAINFVAIVICDLLLIALYMYFNRPWRTRYIQKIPTQGSTIAMPSDATGNLDTGSLKSANVPDFFATEPSDTATDYELKRTTLAFAKSLPANHPAQPISTDNDDLRDFSELELA